MVACSSGRPPANSAVDTIPEMSDETRTTPAAQNLAIEAIGISRSFGGVEALTGAALTASFGEVHALVGENGAGKSTLIKIIGGTVKPDAGSVVIDGEDVTASGPGLPAASASAPCSRS